MAAQGYANQCEVSRTCRRPIRTRQSAQGTLKGEGLAYADYMICSPITPIFSFQTQKMMETKESNAS